MISVIIERNEYTDCIQITRKEDLHHLLHVFRMEVGDKLRAVDGTYEYICEIARTSEEGMELTILEKREDAFSLSVEIDAAISLIKNDKMDLTIQKLSEIGINAILPTQAKRCVVKLKEKKEKWSKIVRESMKQCQGVRGMEIRDIVALKNIDFASYDLVLVPYECEDDRRMKRILAEAREEKKEIRRILYIIGPEGGFEKGEIDFLEEQGAKVLSLGKRILRAETAAIVVGGILVHEFE